MVMASPPSISRPARASCEREASPARPCLADLARQSSSHRHRCTRPRRPNARTLDRRRPGCRPSTVESTAPVADRRHAVERRTFSSHTTRSEDRLVLTYATLCPAAAARDSIFTSSEAKRAVFAGQASADGRKHRQRTNRPSPANDIWWPGAMPATDLLSRRQALAQRLPHHLLDEIR